MTNQVRAYPLSDGQGQLQICSVEKEWDKLKACNFMKMQLVVRHEAENLLLDDGE